MNDKNCNMLDFFNSELNRLEQKIDLTNKNLEILINKIEQNNIFNIKIIDNKIEEYENVLWEQAQRLNGLENNIKKLEKYFYIVLGVLLTINFLLDLAKKFL